MPCAEAKSKIPPYKIYKRVHHAQSFAKGLGVREVDYADRIDIANVANHGLYVCHQRGVPMPHSIRVAPITSVSGEVELANYTPSLGGGTGDILLNGSAAEWLDIAEFARQRREEQDISTGDPRHFVVHEMGELALEQSAGFERANPFGTDYEVVEEQFQQEDLSHVYEVLGDRATHNHGEFVAETFAALMLGHAGELHPDEEIMTLYERYGGADIRKYDEGLR
jgi:hypothetical protein